MIKSLLLVIISLFIVSCSTKSHNDILRKPSSQAVDLILYPGSFDPFHKTHYDEILYIKNENPGARVKILPVHKNYYSRHPSFFNYDQKVEFIENTFSDYQDIQVSTKLRTVDRNVFDSILEIAQDYPEDQKIGLAIGVDVLEIWQALKGFEEFSKKFSLIISKDPSRRFLYQNLKKKYKSNPNITFINTHTEGIRSKGLKKSLLEGSSKIYNNLAKSSRDFLISNDTFREKLISGYKLRLSINLNLLIKRKIFPEILRNTDNSNLFRLIKKYPKVLEQFILIDPNDLSSIGRAAEEIRKIIPRETLERYPALFDHLTTDLVTALTSNKMKDIYNASDFSFDREQYQLFYYKEKLELDNSKFKSPFKFEVKLKHFPKKLLWLETLLINFRNRINQISVNDSLELKEKLQASKASKHHVTVYRGVQNRDDIEKILKRIKTEGFVSKVVLSQILDHKKEMPDAIEYSRQYLEKQGLNNSVIDHIAGDWRKSSVFVATTTDYLIASQYAGKDGYVFKMEVPIESGYFVNDPIFWRNTPWKNNNNPQRELNEFIVRNYIPPSQIKEIEKIEIVPDKVVSATTGAFEVWKAIPWKINKNVKSCFLKLQAFFSTNPVYKK